MKQEPSVVLMSLAVLALVKKNSLTSKERTAINIFIIL